MSQEVGSFRARWQRQSQARSSGHSGSEASESLNENLRQSLEAALGKPVTEEEIQAVEPAEYDWGPQGSRDVEDMFEQPVEEAPAVEEGQEYPAKKPKYTVVDKTPATVEDAAATLRPVAQLLPAELTSEAVRLANTKVFKFPWEKGRLATIFQTPRLPSQPSLRLQPGLDSLVKVNVSVGEGSSLQSEIALKKPDVGSALYTKAVRHMLGGSYVEERTQKRAMSVDLWWNLLRADPA